MPETDHWLKDFIEQMPPSPKAREGAKITGKVEGMALGSADLEVGIDLEIIALAGAFFSSKWLPFWRLHVDNQSVHLGE